MAHLRQAIKRLAVVAALVSAVALSGCKTLNLGGTTTTFKPIEIPNVQPTPMDLREIRWQVYTVEELKAMVAAAEARGDTNVVFYVLTREDYEALAFNLAEMSRFIRDQRATNEYLVEAIRINNQAVEAANGGASTGAADQPRRPAGADRPRN